MRNSFIKWATAAAIALPVSAAAAQEQPHDASKGTPALQKLQPVDATGQIMLHGDDGKIITMTNYFFGDDARKKCGGLVAVSAVWDSFAGGQCRDHKSGLTTVFKKQGRVL